MSVRSRRCVECQKYASICDGASPACNTCSYEGRQCSGYSGKPMKFVVKTATDVRARLTRRERKIANSKAIQTLEVQRPLPSAMKLPDLRLLNHFFHFARPLLPRGRSRVWITDIAAQAHKAPVIMHSLLAVAATHLTSRDKEAMPVANVMEHRQRAIAGIQESLDRSAQQASSDGRHNLTELQNAYTCSMALWIESQFQPEGYADFLVFGRGCAAIAKSIAQHHPNDFGPWIAKWSSAASVSALHPGKTTMASSSTTQPTTNPRILDIAEQSIRALKPLCESDAFWQKFYGWLLAQVEHLRKPLAERSATVSLARSMMIETSEKEFARLKNLDEPVARVLTAHCLALATIDDARLAPGYREEAMYRPVHAHSLWVLKFCEPLIGQPQYFDLVSWPLRCALTEMNHFRKTGWFPESTRVHILLNEPEKYM